MRSVLYFALVKKQCPESSHQVPRVSCKPGSVLQTVVGRRFQIVLRGGSRGGADASPGSAAAAEKRRRRLRRRGPGADGLTPRQRLLRRSDAFWHFVYLMFFRGVAGRLPAQRAIPASVRPALSSQVEAALLHPPRTGARGTWTTSSPLLAR